MKPVSFLALAIAATAPALSAEPGKPAISEQTMRSGGEQPAEQAALTLSHLDLSLEVLPEREMLSGVAKLDFTIAGTVRNLLLDLDPNLAVQDITIAGRKLPKSAWDNPEGRLTIRLPAPATDTLSATIRYAGKPHVAVRAPWDDGIVWSTHNGKPWIATSAQGYGCDLYWPCIDHPKGEVGTLDFHITVPAGLKAPGPGILQHVETLPDGRTRWDWRAKSLNPYLIALQVGPYGEMTGSYASRFGNKVPLAFWYLEDRKVQAEGLFAEFAPTLDFFESMIGPFPFGAEKLGVAETPHLGMEHQTINAYGNNYKKAPEGFDWLFQHELSHEWFGNQMTAADWDDFWLHEGYGNYMQPLYGQWREGEARYATMMAAQRLNIQNRAPLVSGQTRIADDVYEDARSGPGQDIYYKGAWVLHTLRYAIGDKAFFEATRRLVYGRPDPKPGNFVPRFATTAELVEIVNKVTGQDYRWFFDVYVYSAALPELIETRDGDRLTLTWRTPTGKPFPLPIDVQIDGKVQRLPMTGGGATLTLAPGAHVVIDPMARTLRRSEAIEAAKAASAH